MFLSKLDQTSAQQTSGLEVEDSEEFFQVRQFFTTFFCYANSQAYHTISLKQCSRAYLTLYSCYPSKGIVWCYHYLLWSLCCLEILFYLFGITQIVLLCSLVHPDIPVLSGKKLWWWQTSVLTRPDEGLANRLAWVLRGESSDERGTEGKMDCLQVQCKWDIVILQHKRKRLVKTAKILSHVLFVMNCVI